ncbi:hypothetical protein BV20DRAFT_1054014 [Pilatotrama ljubarskyi]|nr:hypothetical protein BV20DRAFT_1054014 [Pilatotrama ljubarskyi]
MDIVLATLQAVEAAAAKSKSSKADRVAEIAGHISSHLVLLKLQSISEQIVHKLSGLLRESLRTLYDHITLPALRLASAIFQVVYHERLLPTIGNMQREQQGLWEMVLHALLAGVLDYLDARDTKEAKDAIADALYPSLCEVCLSLTAPKTSVDLRCTAYNILSDSAASHQPNQQKLRDRHILGGERLGSCIWRTRDYLALEGLLNLFARALPSTHNSASGRSKRTAYIHSVFKACAPPESVTTANRIAELLENVTTSDWEETALRIVDLLAQGNIAYPQPFIIVEVLACGNTYPSDRLYADDKAFLANVLLGDDQYETLEIAYTAIKLIGISRADTGGVEVVLLLDGPPRLGKEHVRARGDSKEVSPLDAFFAVACDQFSGLMAALRSRGLAELVSDDFKTVPMPKLSLAAYPAMLEFDSAGRPVIELSQEERIDNVSQFYRTEDPSDDIVSAGDTDSFLEDVTAALPTHGLVSDASVKDKGDRLQTKPSPFSAPPECQAQSHRTAITGNSYKSLTSVTGSASLSRSGSHLIRAAAFGLSDEELSDISDCDSPHPRSTALRRSGTSISLGRGRISFEPVLTKSTVTSSSATRIARGAVGKVVLDSDDKPPAAPVSSVSRRTRRKAALLRERTIDSQPLLALASPPALVLPAVAGPLSAKDPALAALATPSPAPGDATLVSSNAHEKVLRFSDIPAPDFNAPFSSPAFVPKSALKSVMVKKTAPSVQDKLATLDAGSAYSASVSAAPMKNAKALAVNVNDILSDLVPASSSPTPAAKKSIKSALRKRDQTQVALGEPCKPRAAKRKIAEPENPQEPVPVESADNDEVRATKRLRKSITAVVTAPSSGKDNSKPREGVVDERSESQGLRPRRTAATRATRKYHAKKGRASSPVETSALMQEARLAPVDYDALPSPPHTSTATGKSSPSIPKGKRGSKPQPKPKGGEVDVAAKAVEIVNASTARYDEVEGKSVAIAPTRRARARARGAQVKENKAPTGGGLGLGLANELPPPAAAGKPQPRRSRRDMRDKAENVSAVEVVDMGDALADIHDLPEPADDCQAYDVVPPVSDESVVTLAAKSEEAKTHDPSTSEQLQAVQGELSAETSVAKKPAAKRSDITSWDATIHSTPTKCASTENKEDLSAGVEGPPIVADDSGRTETSGAILAKLEGSRVQEQVTSPGIVFAASPKPLPATRPDGRTTVAERPEKAVPRTLPVVILESDPRRDSRRDNASTSRAASMPLPVEVKREVETIDLTCDSPPKLTKRPYGRTLGHEGMIAKPSPTTSATMPSEGSTSNALKGLHRMVDVPKEENMDLWNLKPRNDQPTARVVEVLGRLNDVIARKIEHGLEGVRYHARIGRSDLLRNAVEDLHAMHAESIAHFNRLVDLEAEYATVGRGLQHQGEDWKKTNEELSQRLTQALEQHDKKMLSKWMPTTLITSPF